MSSEPTRPAAEQDERLMRERQEREQRLYHYAHSGHLTLGEYAKRTDTLARARTIPELDAPLQDLPDQGSSVLDLDAPKDGEGVDEQARGAI